MNKREQEQFVAFFQEIYQTEQLLDFIKLQLVQSSSYNPNLLFNLISEKGETISLQQLRGYLSDKAACNQRQLYEIFQRFDWNRQGVIERTDFLNELTPFGRQVQSLNLTGGSLTAEIEGHFISLFLQILKRFRIQEVARKQIRYIQPYDAFQHIDHLKTGFIGITQLRKLFFDNDFNVTDQQLYYLLHGLRRRCYRDINLEVFCENLDPLQFGQYLAYQSKIEEQKQKDYLNRSRHEEESVKRSRLQAQRIQHEFQKAERKKQAEYERHLELQERATVEVLKYDEQKERQIRRALLEQDRDIRYGLAAGGEVALRREQIRNAQDSLQNQYLHNIRLREEEVNKSLVDSALKREEELERSRRVIERERDILYREREQLEREKNILRSAAVAKELQFSHRRIEEESRRRYQQDSIRRVTQESRRKYQGQILKRKEEENYYQKRLEASRKELQQSKKRYNGENKLQDLRRKAFQESSQDRDKYYRQIELERQRASKEIAQIRANRIPEYQKQLQRTRYDAAQERSRRGGEISAYR